ncbi:sporulation phosphorelay system protein KapB [Paenibacillus lutrae]|uniref:Kinase n=1 Tax=Paenibacillus lutrae TaxID=2078573 RepID=A0A7X3FIM5_9BACL|nr:sporulation phosphorelay system protein KapB [Paenibacillus lutrae]MVP00318.1 kinase [Paenibacillus lutrae]
MNLRNEFAASVGDLVKGEYKTGEYIGRIVEINSPVKAAVQVLAVIKHPTQGDLHTADRNDLRYFQQRRALAYQEIALMPLVTIRSYNGNVPDYMLSLQHALEEELSVLQQTEEWARRSIAELEELHKDYFPQ